MMQVRKKERKNNEWQYKLTGLDSVAIRKWRREFALKKIAVQRKFKLVPQKPHKENGKLRKNGTLNIEEYMEGSAG